MSDPKPPRLVVGTDGQAHECVAPVAERVEELEAESAARFDRLENLLTTCGAKADRIAELEEENKAVRQRASQFEDAMEAAEAHVQRLTAENQRLHESFDDAMSALSLANADCQALTADCDKYRRLCEEYAAARKASRELAVRGGAQRQYEEVNQRRDAASDAILSAIPEQRDPNQMELRQEPDDA